MGRLSTIFFICLIYSYIAFYLRTLLATSNFSFRYVRANIFFTFAQSLTIFQNMNSLQKSVILLLSLFSLCLTASRQIVDDVPLYGPTPPPGTIPHAPSHVPVQCFVIRSANSIFFTSNTIVTEADVVLVNTSTGEISNEEVYISSIPDGLSLSSSGDYTVQITLPYGAVYYGEFAFW